MLAANTARLHLCLSSIFTEHFIKDFEDYLHMHVNNNGNSSNMQSDLILNVLPFLLSKILPLLPEKYKQSFLFLSYLYYNISF